VLDLTYSVRQEDKKIDMKSGTFPLAVNHKREDDYTRQLGANSP
jgi:hypothetical protein